MSDIVERLREEAGKAMYQYAHRVSVDILLKPQTRTKDYKELYDYDDDDDIEKCIAILELAIHDVEPYIPTRVIEIVICYLKDYDRLKYEEGWDITDNRGEFA